METSRENTEPILLPGPNTFFENSLQAKSGKLLASEAVLEQLGGRILVAGWNIRPAG